MATTLVHEPPAAKLPAGDGTRFVSVRANLLPAEIISARQIEVVRKQVVLGLVLVVALLIGWFGLSWWQTQLANSDLDDAQHQTTALQNQQTAFGPLVNAQNQSNTIHGQLHNLMTADLPWTKMLTRIRDAAPTGVRLTGINASVTAGVPAATAGGATSLGNGTVLNATGQLTVGQVAVSGSAGTKSAVAAYVDKLGGVPGLTAAVPSAVTSVGGSVTFTINVLITSQALGGRYAAAPPAPTGGK